MKNAPIARFAAEYINKGRISHACPNCGNTGIKTKGYTYKTRGSISILCPNCGEIGFFDGLAEIHKNADYGTITDLTKPHA